MGKVIRLFSPALVGTLCGRIHVLDFNGMLAVEHESASGESRALLSYFAPDMRSEAIMYAVDQLLKYAPCEIGEIVPCR